MGPIRNPRHISMLDWIDMNVVDVAGQIVLIADRVLPIAPLPDAALTFGSATGRNSLTCKVARKRRFNQPPARWKIPIVLGHRPDRMEMIRQHDQRVDRERMTLASFTNGRA